MLEIINSNNVFDGLFSKSQQQSLMSRTRYELVLKLIFGKYKEHFEDEWEITNPSQLLRVLKSQTHIMKDEWGDKDVEMFPELLDDIEVMVMNEGEIYNDYFANLPGDFRENFEELTVDYMNGRLNDFDKSFNVEPIEFTEQEQIEDLPVWAWRPAPEYSDEELRNIYSIATQRATAKNKDQVYEARKDLFIIYNQNADLADRLGIKDSELFKKIKGYGGLKRETQQLEDRLNQGIPDSHKWVGLSNMAFLGRQQFNFNLDDVSGFVKGIGIEEGSMHSKNELNNLSRYLMEAFIAIDSHFDFKDLEVNLSKELDRGNGKTWNGIYQYQNRSIKIAKNQPNTVYHELGHHIDHQLGEQFGSNYFLTNATHINSQRQDLHGDKPIEQLKWADQFHEFIYELTKKANIGSEYMQRSQEVFARFVAEFVGWVAESATGYKTTSYYGDNFSSGDFQNFVKLLQQKSYLNKYFPMENRKKK